MIKRMEFKKMEESKFKFIYCVYAYSHIKIFKIYLSPHISDDFYHGKTHFYHIFCLLNWIPFIRIDKADYDIAISYCVNFVYFIENAHFVEFSKKIS